MLILCQTVCNLIKYIAKPLFSLVVGALQNLWQIHMITTNQTESNSIYLNQIHPIQPNLTYSHLCHPEPNLT